MRWRRWLRKLGFGRNDMRRGSDRVERWLTAGALLAFVVAVPFVAGEAARAMYARTSVTPSRTGGGSSRWRRCCLRTPPRRTPALPASRPTYRWPGPLERAERPDPREHPAGGRRRQGRRPNGDLDQRQGTPSSPPLELDARSDAAVVGIGAGLGLATMLGLLTCAVRGLLNRHRMRSWQYEWLDVGPRWTRQC